MDSSDDYKDINGPKVAASIINNLPEGHKKRIMGSIQAKSPDVFKRIESDLVTVDDIASMNARGAQALIKSIASTDLIIVLKHSSEKVIENLFKNMSQRATTIVTEDISASPDYQKAEIEAAFKRVVTEIDRLRTEGIAQVNSTDDVWV